MKVAIHQPNYLPWLGWFAKAAQADMLILLDDVQFERGGVTNRTFIKTTTHEMLRLTIPVTCTSGDRILSISEVECQDGSWRRKHMRSLTQHYQKSPGWEKAVGQGWFTPIENPRARSLAHLNWDLLETMMDEFGIKMPVVWASSLRKTKDRHTGTAGLQQLLETVNATEYICGKGSKDYQDDWRLEAAGIDVTMSTFQPRPEEMLGLSALDMLMNRPTDAPRFLRQSIA